MSGTRLSAISGYTNVDAAQDATQYIQRLDAVGASGFWRTLRRAMLESLALREGDRALDLGCGTGCEARAMAARVGRSGSAVGVDQSAAMVTEARSRAMAAGSPARFLQATALRLPFPDGSFDAWRVERVLQHLDRPEDALSELFRIARRGARLAIAEPDYAAMRIEGAHPALTSRLIEARCAHFRAADIGRRLVRLLRDLGAVELLVVPAWYRSAYFAGQRQALQEKFVQPALVQGAITAAEAARWLDDLTRAAERGDYRQSVIVYRLSGRIP